MWNQNNTPLREVKLKRSTKAAWVKTGPTAGSEIQTWFSRRFIESVSWSFVSYIERLFYGLHASWRRNTVESSLMVGDQCLLTLGLPYTKNILQQEQITKYCTVMKCLSCVKKLVTYKDMLSWWDKFWLPSTFAHIASTNDSTVSYKYIPIM